MPKDSRGVGFIFIIFIILILILVGLAGYYLGNQNSSKEPPQTSATPIPTLSATSTPAPTATPSPTPSPTIKPGLLENIKASIVSKNTAALDGYMTDTVNVIAEATECCGNVSKSAAIKEIDTLIKDATLPWNFDDDNPIALQLKQKNPQAFPDGIIIGTSENRKLITFTLNGDKTKIVKVYTAVDYKLHGI